MNLSRNIPKKYLVIVIVAPFFLFLAGLLIEELIKFNGTCYFGGFPNGSVHYYKCSMIEYIKSDVFGAFIFYVTIGLPLYLIFFIIPISAILLIIYLYKKLRAKS